METIFKLLRIIIVYPIVFVIRWVLIIFICGLLVPIVYTAANLTSSSYIEYTSFLKDAKGGIDITILDLFDL